MIGRAYIWRLAGAEVAGVERVLKILRAESESGIALCRTPTLENIDRDAL